jgi:hypothetical protein
MISVNQKLFARRVDLSQAGRKIALAREATQFVVFQYLREQIVIFRHGRA